MKGWVLESTIIVGRVRQVPIGRMDLCLAESNVTEIKRLAIAGWVGFASVRKQVRSAKRQVPIKALLGGIDDGSG